MEKGSPPKRGRRKVSKNEINNHQRILRVLQPKMKLMPQEVEVWYLIPAIRRELAKCFIAEYGMSQKKVAEVLGITESAVSQYLKEKRGGELKFTKDEMDKITKVADKIVNDPSNVRKLLFEISQELRGTESLCKLHKKHDPDVEKNCKICIGG